jgi:hypothetical protein
MDLINILEINPLFSSFNGISLILINYLFAYKLSSKIILINNSNLNFIFFNIIFYFIISPILLFLVFINLDLNFIKYFLYAILIIKLFFIFYWQKIKIIKFKFFNKIDLLILFLILLFLLPQITDADSLDYHLGAPLDVIRNGGLYNRLDEWYSFRFLGLNEMLNLYGLFFYSLNFGQIFQIVAFSNLILFFKLFIKKREYIYLILFSFPLFTSILLSTKNLLIISNCYFLVFAIYFFKIKFTKKIIFLVLILIIVPLGFKYSYLIYSLPIWIFFILLFKNKISFYKLLIHSSLIFLFFSSIVYFKNFYFYGDPLSPFFEFLKKNPDINLIKFADNVRYSLKIFSIYELPIVPFFHFIPLRLSEISLILSPVILSFYFILHYNNINQKTFALLLLSIFLIQFFSGKSLSRYFIDLYFLSLFYVLFNLNRLRFKNFFKYLLYASIPYSFLTISIILYSIISLTIPLFNNNLFKNSMYRKAHNYEIVDWVNKNVKNNEIVLYDKIIRSKTYQKHNFFYYDISSKSYDEIYNLLIENKINKLVLPKKVFNEKFKENYMCEFINRKNLNEATRNPINSKKNVANIYILDSSCFKS